MHWNYTRDGAVYNVRQWIQCRKNSSTNCLLDVQLQLCNRIFNDDTVVITIDYDMYFRPRWLLDTVCAPDLLVQHLDLILGSIRIQTQTPVHEPRKNFNFYHITAVWKINIKAGLHSGIFIIVCSLQMNLFIFSKNVTVCWDCMIPEIIWGSTSNHPINHE